MGCIFRHLLIHIVEGMEKEENWGKKDSMEIYRKSMQKGSNKAGRLR